MKLAKWKQKYFLKSVKGQIIFLENACHIEQWIYIAHK